MKVMLFLLVAMILHLIFTEQATAQERDNSNAIYAASLKRATELSEKQSSGQFQRRRSVPITPYDAIVGREGSANRLLVYFQIGCEHCKAMWANISRKLVGRNIEIRVLFVPASYTQSGLITLYECAARKTKAFGKAGVDLLFSVQSPTLNELMPGLRAAGMSMDDVAACLKNEAHYSNVAQRREVLLQSCGTIPCVINATAPARKYAMFGTPTWIIETGGASSEAVQASNSGSGNNAKFYDAIEKLR